MTFPGDVTCNVIWDGVFDIKDEAAALHIFFPVFSNGAVTLDGRSSVLLREP